MMEVNKAELIQYLCDDLENQKELLVLEKESINKEIAKETKSSAGDKFETSREMMNQERGRIENRIAHLNQLLRIANDMSSNEPVAKISFGSLVKTSHGWFLFGLALGKLNYKNNVIFALSLNSPIGKVFHQIEETASIHFMNKIYTIEKIY